jgi:RES domain-containing protein
VPAEEPIRLDRLVSDDGEDDRWNAPGEPTVYLATELPVALAELARHLRVGGGGEPVRRRLLGLTIDVDDLLDLRCESARRAVGAPTDPAGLRDRDAARAIGRRAREELAANGLLAPSMAFPDDSDRLNLVLFMERLGGDIGDLVTKTHEAGLVEIRPIKDGAGWRPPELERSGS